MAAPGGAETRSVRVLVVDDHPAVRAGVTSLLDAVADLRAVAAVANASDAAAAAAKLRPDVAIVDFQLPGRDGLSLAIELKRFFPPPRVLIYSMFADERLTVGALVAGADAVVKKGSPSAELCDAVRAVARGSRYVSDVSSETLQTIAAQLEPHDVAVLRMLMRGARAGDVAATLGMSDEWLTIRRWAILQRVVGSGRRPR